VSIFGLIRAAFDLYRRNLRVVLLVTVPVVLVVTGLTALGLGELGAHYKPGPPARDTWIDIAASELVTQPLLSSILAALVLRRRRGEPVVASDLVAGALELFPTVLAVIVVWLGVSVAGVALLFFPGIYFYVSWYFVVQAVVIEGDRGLAPISRSAALVRGYWWQSAAVGIAFQLVADVPALLIVTAFDALARAANTWALVVVGTAVASVVALPFLAIGATLYYLRLRDAAATVARV
jgi:hypothetical protein